MVWQPVSTLSSSRTCYRFWGVAEREPSRGASARRSPTGGDRTSAFRARSVHPVHIPKQTGMRTRDKPRAAFLGREHGPGPAPPADAPGPACGTLDHSLKGRPWRCRRPEAGPAALPSYSGPPAPSSPPPPGFSGPEPSPPLWILESPPLSSPGSCLLRKLIRTPKALIGFCYVLPVKSEKKEWLPRPSQNPNSRVASSPGFPSCPQGRLDLPLMGASVGISHPRARSPPSWPNWHHQGQRPR